VKQRSRLGYRLRAPSFVATVLAFAPGGVGAAPAPPPAAIPIKHVVVIMQENRSFDHYFGTYPGADGIPPGVCVPLDPAKPSRGCAAPFHDEDDVNAGGPHNAAAAQADIADGITTALQNGYVHAQTIAANGLACQQHPNNPKCASSMPGVLAHDVVGYHTADEIPNYWAYANHFVLQDRLFPGVRTWSLPSHLDLVSEWVASCTNSSDAATCVTTPELPFPTKTTQYPWANLFQLLDVHGVSWKYYLGLGPEPDCVDGQMTCDPQLQQTIMPSIWNPTPFFKYIKQQGAGYLAGHDVQIEHFLADITTGKLPAVSWIVPSQDYSEHPFARVTTGMEYVTSLVNAVMQSPYWQDTAIFITWDDWGGFYDHVDPPNVDTNGTATPIQGFGIRVPGLMLSAYARQGYIDHALYSFDSYATLIEDLFAGSARLDPAALGNPDHRPHIRDALTSVTFLDGHSETIGDLLSEFDFTQKPLPPLVLSTHIPTGITADCVIKKRICTSSTVTLTWNAVTGPEVPGPFTYHIQRDGIELAQCVGTATTCVDAPGTGTHHYRAYSVDQSGTASPLSAAASVDEP